MPNDVRLHIAIRETHHRVKNNLQLLAGMVDLCLEDKVEFIPVADVRRIGTQIRAIATLHDLLTTTVEQSVESDLVPVGALMAELLPLLNRLANRVRIEVVGRDALITSRKASALVLVMSELVGNSLKHANGEVALTFTSVDGIGTMEVYDDGPGFAPAFDAARCAHTGFQLVNLLTSWDLGGRVRYENRTEGGASVAVEFPLT